MNENVTQYIWLNRTWKEGIFKSLNHSGQNLQNHNLHSEKNASLPNILYSVNLVSNIQ